MATVTQQQQQQRHRTGGVKKRRRRRGTGADYAPISNPPRVVKRLQGITVASCIKSRILLCSDGVTRIPYEVLGSDDCGDPSSSGRSNFVVCHDIFDCLDATKLLFLDVLKKHPGCQILVFNQPGQAGTTFPRNSSEQGQETHTINNDFHARTLHELLSHACLTGEFGTNRQFHLLGIGNGVSIALSFADIFASSDLCKDALKSIVSINGYASIDPQLAGILHSAKNAFLSFPSNRPDLPVSYMSNYLFSDEYIDKVSRNLALNIHTAVMNPISLEGRVCLVSGALKNRLMGADARTNHQIPIVAIQSTENRLVSPSNVESLLEGRTVSYIWSHQLRPDGHDCYSKTDLPDMLDECFRSNSCIAIFARAGHALAQEWKSSISELLRYLALSRGPCLQSKPSCFRGQAARDGAAPIDNKDAGNDVVGCDDTKDENSSPENALVRGHTCPYEEGSDTIQPAVLSDANETGNEDSSRKGSCRVDNETSPIQPSELADANVSDKSSVDTTALAKIDTGTTLSDDKEVSGANAESSPANIPCGKESADCSQDDELQADVHTSVNEGKELSLYPNEAADASCSLGEFQSGIHTSVVHEKQTLPLEQQNNDVDKIEHSPCLYTVRGAPDPFEGHEENMPLPSIPSLLKTNDLASETRRTKQIPSLEEYVSAGVPVDFVPSEIIVGHPDANQKKSHRWFDATSSEGTPMVIPPPTAEELQAEFYKELEFEREREKRQIESKKSLPRDAMSGRSQLQREQEGRRLEYQQEDAQEVEKLERENLAREKERARKQMQRQVEIDDIESVLVQDGIVKPFIPKKGDAAPVRSIPPTTYTAPGSLPSHLANIQLHNVLDGLESDALMAKKMGILRMEEFDSIRSKMAQQHLEKEEELRLLNDAERHRLLSTMAILIQRVARGRLGRIKAREARMRLDSQIHKMNAVVLIQKCTRGVLGRMRARAAQQHEILQLVMGRSVATIQRIWRGHRGRCLALSRRQWKAALALQTVVRGYFGRKIAEMERQRVERIRLEIASALKIQCAWRVSAAQEEHRVLQVQRLASTELQRVLRGYLARKRVTKLRLWSNTEPGAARIELGLQLIQESKDEFDRHQEELDGLHRAQELAETRVNHIYNALKESEKDLEHLQGELDGLDHMEDDFIEETDFSPPAFEVQVEVDTGSDAGRADEVTKTQRVSAPRLERMLQMQKVERDKRKQYLETELNVVLSEVKEKRVALERLELAISDMEETRQRKDREFRRLQRDLMGLLNEQKDELDQLREKGIELETATATTAAAAAATAVKARDHEEQTAKMFNQQEELMKFQFMSMSLSYFSSLGMLKQMRNMASDATAAAVSNSADTAAAAAAAAAAANIPCTGSKSVGRVSDKDKDKMGAKKEMEERQRMWQQQTVSSEDEEQEPLPSDCHLWTIGDVSKWLGALSLGAYVDRFEEACVDGEFLLELKEEDLAGVLGMEHKLHRKKLILARDKLRPLSEEEKRMKESFALEETADQKRKELKVPDSDVVFSQARHGRLRRLEESLEDGFNIDTKDDQGNTLLMTAVQNGHKKTVDLLVRRGSSVNHVNSCGNTALHFALAYDKSGEMATYLIERGADDTIENNQGLTGYDGLGDEERTT